MPEENNKLKTTLLEFTKDSYDLEIQNKNYINSRIPSIVTMFTVLFAASVYFIKPTECPENNFLKMSFLITWSIYNLILLLGLCFLYRFLFSYTYSYAGTPEKISNYLKDLEKYNLDLIKYNSECKASGVKPGKESIDLNIKLYDTLFEHYSSSACANRTNNITKNKYFIKTLMSIYFATIFLVITTFLFHAETMGKSYKTLFNQKELKMSQDERNTMPEEPVEPTMPEIDRINESSSPPSDIKSTMEQNDVKTSSEE